MVFISSKKKEVPHSEISAIVLAKVSARKDTEKIADEIRKALPLLKDLIFFEVIGPYDIGIAIPSVLSIKELNREIVEKIRKIDNIIETVTLITDPSISELLTSLTQSTNAVARELERINMPALASIFRDFGRYLQIVFLEFYTMLNKCVTRKDFWSGVIAIILSLATIILTFLYFFK